MHINSNKGFSLIEVMISIGIIMAIMGTVFFNYSSSNDSLALDSAGHELSIAIRQAQVYGLSVKESGVGTGAFTDAYGIYFNPTQSPNDYYIFIDKNSNYTYDPIPGCGVSGTECVERLSFRNNIRITGICDTSQCPPVGATKLSVLFRRPNTDAGIYFLNNSNAIIAGPVSRGRIVITSPKSNTADVIIESTGQIVFQ